MKNSVFEKKVRPVLVSHCHNCHSADTKPAGSLRVDEGRGQRRLDTFEERLRDNPRTPQPEVAAFRIDFPQFIGSLCRRDQRLAGFLSLGNSATDAAARFGLSPGRVTQLRQGWCREWHVRNGDDTPRRLRLCRKTTSEREDRADAAGHSTTSA
jgi:hypothetical protein